MHINVEAIKIKMKAAIRREIIDRRNSITREEVAEKGAVIQKRVIELARYLDTKALGLYASFNNEVPTSLIFNEAVKDGKKVLFPCILKEEKRLIFLPVQEMSELELGPYGIMSPKCNEDDTDSIAEAGVLLIPGVAYDAKGGRLGYGGGFYDRTLPRLERLPFIVAMAYEFQVLDEIPMCAHDIRVDAVVTEERVIICK